VNELNEIIKLKEHACVGGIQGFYKHESTECGGPMSFAVYRPAAAVAGERCPVVLYLSGLTCSEENVTAKAGAQRVCAELGAIFVAPDTSPRGAGYPGEDDDWDFGTGAGFYVDATVEPWSERYRMYSYVAELRALIDAELPTRADAWSITGHSMGGHGALVLGLREPDRWRRVSALAPIGAPMRCPWGEKAFSGYLGDDREAWKAYDASELVRRRPRGDRILIDQGDADPFLDAQLSPELFHAACAEAGQDLELRMQPGYDHSYYFVATFIEDHLRFLLE
jgi:S-formylglutathione hydrolase